MFRSGFIHII